MSTPPHELSLVPIAPTSSPDATANAASLPPVPQSRPLGPGWFDSSFELHRGLDVSEGWSDEARLRVWLDAFLDARPASSAGGTSSFTPASDAPTRRD